MNIVKSPTNSRKTPENRVTQQEAGEVLHAAMSHVVAQSSGWYYAGTMEADMQHP